MLTLEQLNTPYEQQRVIECSQKSTQKPRQNSRHPERRGRKRETWDYCNP